MSTTSDSNTMNLLKPITLAVDRGMSIVCAPQIYGLVLDKVRELEHLRNVGSISQGRGPSLMQPICVEHHPEQKDPILLTFDDWIVFKEYLSRLEDERKKTARHISV